MLAQCLRHLERIGDHAVNIAEDVIYMAKGSILRHSREHTIPKERIPTSRYQPPFDDRN